MAVPRNSFVTIDKPNHICIEPFMDDRTTVKPVPTLAVVAG
jgi:glutamine amidotransferase